MSKIWRISQWFQIRGSNIKKVHTEKVICQKLLRVSSIIEEDKLQFCTLFLPITFLVSKFFAFLENRGKSLHSIIGDLCIPLYLFLFHVAFERTGNSTWHSRSSFHILVYCKKGKFAETHSDNVFHGPNIYKDAKPLMSSLLVFNRVYRLDPSTPLVN